MIKFKDVEINTEFIYLEEAGVYKKISESKAKCLSGGCEFCIDPDVEILVITCFWS